MASNFKLSILQGNVNAWKLSDPMIRLSSVYMWSVIAIGACDRCGHTYISCGARPMQ